MEKDFSLEITSKDDFKVSIPSSYTLCRGVTKKESKLVTGFKNSILGMDIGINSKGFSYVAILSTLLAIGSLLIMYILLRVN